MRRCAGIIRGTVSPHGDGHDSMRPSATRSAVPGRDGFPDERGLYAVRVSENATQRGVLASDCVVREGCARTVPLEHRPMRAPDAVAANRRSACSTGEKTPRYACGCAASITIRRIVNPATIA